MDSVSDQCQQPLFKHNLGIFLSGNHSSLKPNSTKLLTHLQALHYFILAMENLLQYKIFLGCVINLLQRICVNQLFGMRWKTHLIHFSRDLNIALTSQTGMPIRKVNDN